MTNERFLLLPIQDMVDMKQCLVDTWSGFWQSIVDNAIDERQKRLQVCVDEKGGHFEHLL